VVNGMRGESMPPMLADADPCRPTIISDRNRSRLLIAPPVIRRIYR
jgi:hypothetical protein